MIKSMDKTPLWGVLLFSKKNSGFRTVVFSGGICYNGYETINWTVDL